MVIGFSDNYNVGFILLSSFITIFKIKQDKPVPIVSWFPILPFPLYAICP